MKKITSIGGMEFQVIVDGDDVNLVWEDKYGSSDHDVLFTTKDARALAKWLRAAAELIDQSK